MEEIKAPSISLTVATIVDNIKLFLGGGISNCPNWQLDIVELLNIYPRLTIFNPRRNDYDPTVEEGQICWEFKHLAESDIIVFWFPHETVCPITLFELGKWLTRTDKTIIIGVDEEYSRKNDILIQVGLERPELEVWVGFEEFKNAILLEMSKQYNH